MPKGGGSTVTFTGTGVAVSGASSDLYRGDNASVSVTFAAPLSEIVGLAGGFDHQNFNREDISLAGAEIKGLGVGFGFAVTRIREEEYRGYAISVDASLIAGGTVTVIGNSWNPLKWNLVGNAYATLSTGMNFGLFGVGIGAEADVTLDEGALVTSGNVNFGLAGVKGERTLLVLDRSDANNLPPNVLSIANQAGFGTQAVYHNDYGTGLRVRTEVFYPAEGGKVQGATTTTVLTSNPTTGTNADLLRGNVYPAGNVEVGYELNALDQIAEAAHIRSESSSSSGSAGNGGPVTSGSTTAGGNSGNSGRLSTVPSYTAGWVEDRFRLGLVDSSSSGNSSSSSSGISIGSVGGKENHSVPSSTGTWSRGYEDEDGPGTTQSVGNSSPNYTAGWEEDRFRLGLVDSSSSGNSDSSSSGNSSNTGSSSPNLDLPGGWEEYRFGWDDGNSTAGGSSGTPSNGSSSNSGGSSSHPSESGGWEEDRSGWDDGDSSSGGNSDSSSDSNSNDGNSTSNWAEEMLSGKPVIIDLDGDGVEIDISHDVAFDIDGDGYLEQTTWAAPDDGFLVVDLDENGEINGAGDGVIDQANELALARWGDGTMTDLQALAEATDENGRLIFDTNGDGVLDADDDVWNSMKIFQDLDQDGEVDEGELRTLDDWGISQINLAYDDGSGFDETDDNITVLNNTLNGLASFVMNGEVIEGGVGDLALDYVGRGWRRVETDDGYRIELEGGDSLDYWDASELESPDIDLTVNELAGAFGDDRENVLDATGLTTGVTIAAAAGVDRVIGGEGDDLLDGGEGADTIDAGGGDDVVFADSADDASAGNILGGEGYDRLIMGEDAALDVADLGAIGFEAVEASDEDDRISGLEDTNYSLSGNGGNDTLATAGGSDFLTGGAGDDELTSGGGSDWLYGESGDDILDAGDGDDFLSGGSGDDILRGGGGDDVYFYLRGDGSDTILDAGSSSVGTDRSNPGGDKLLFGPGISLEDLRLTRDGDDLLIYVDDGTGANVPLDEVTDVIRIENWTNSENRIEVLRFFDGIDVDLSALAEAIVVGEFGNGDEVVNITQELRGTILIETPAGSEASKNLILDGQFGEPNSYSTVQTDDPYIKLDLQSEFAIKSVKIHSHEVDNHDLNGTVVKLLDRDGNVVHEFEPLTGSEAGLVFELEVPDFVDARYVLLEAPDDHLSVSEIEVFGRMATRDGAVGSNDRDWINGDELANIIKGRGGDDFLFGRDGDDDLSGGAGDDDLFGGDGNDTLRGGTGGDHLLGERGDDVIEGGAGDDVLTGGAGDDVLRGGLGDDMYIFERGDGSDTILDAGSGSVGTDRSNLGGDKLLFGPGISLEDLRLNRDVDDLLIYVDDGTGANVPLDEVTDVIRIENWTNSENRIEVLQFFDGIDVDLSALAEAIVVGEFRNVNITQELGGVILIAATEGNDSLKSAILDGQIGRDNSYDSIRSDDPYIKLDLQSEFAIKSVRIHSHEAFYSDLNGTVVKLLDRDGNVVHEFEPLTGSESGVVFELEVPDFVDAQYVILEDPDDYLSVSEIEVFGRMVTRDGAVGSNQSDWISGDQFANTLEGRGGDDFLFGRDGDDDLSGGAGDDDLFGGDGNDTLRGGAGGDHLLGGRGDDVAEGEAGDDVLTGGAGDDDLSGGAGDDDLFGGDGNDTLRGGTGGDHLLGGRGDDVIEGEAGDDVLIGGAGDDVLRGGLGDDMYIFERGDGSDTILDAGSSSVGADRSNPGGDKLLFGPGISLEDLRLNRDGDDLLIYVDDGTGANVPLDEVTDVIRIENWTNSENRIEVLRFFDGIDVDVSALAEAIVVGEFGNGDEVVNITQELRGTILIEAPLESSGPGKSAILDGQFGESHSYSTVQTDDPYIKLDLQSEFAIESVRIHSLESRSHDLNGTVVKLLDSDGNVVHEFEPLTGSENGVGFELLVPDFVDAQYVLLEAPDDHLSVSEIEVFGRMATRDGAVGSNERDWISGDELANFVKGRGGDDFLFGRGGDDDLSGGAGDDDLFGGDGNDTLRGGTGGDHLFGGRGDDLIDGEAGDDVLTGGAGDDVLRGGLGDDMYIFERGDGSDTILDAGSGSVGTDRSNLGGDKLLFGPGISLEDLRLNRDGDDLLIYVDDGTGANVPLDEVTDVIRIENWTNSENRIEVLRFFDGIDVDVSALAEAIVVGEFGNGDEVVNITQELRGTILIEAPLESSGPGKSAILDGQFGESHSYSTVQTDDPYIKLDLQSEFAIESVRIHSLESRSHDLNGTVVKLLDSDGNVVHEFEPLTGSENGVGFELLVPDFVDAQYVLLEAPDDHLSVSEIEVFGRMATRDGAVGSNERDWISGDELANFVKGRGGDDFLFGRGGDDDLSGGAGDDDLFGGDGNDTLRGGTGGDHLFGGRGDDLIDGEAGDDVLTGGAGDDVLRGGLGDDMYIFERGDGSDTILDAGSSSVGADRSNPGGDKLLFGPGISLEDLRLNRDGDDLLIYVDDGTGANVPLDEVTDVIRIENWTNSENRIEVLRFFDGIDVDVSALAEAIVVGEFGNGDEVVNITQELRGTILIEAPLESSGPGKSAILDGQFGESHSYSTVQTDDPYIKLDLQSEFAIESVRIHSLESRSHDLNGTVVKLLDSDGNVVHEFEPLTGSENGVGFELLVPDFVDAQYVLLEAPDDHLSVSEIEVFGRMATRDGAVGSNERDWISGDELANFVKGRGGDDFLFGRGGDDDLSGGAGDDDLFGGDGNDTLRGGTGGDHLFGGRGDDLIDGEAGDDVLTGGAGDDVLRGGLGDDMYIFERGDGHDTIQENVVSFSAKQGGWVSESRTGATVSALDGDHDTLQFGHYIDIDDLIVSTEGTGNSTTLAVRLVPLVAGDEIMDSVTVANWGMSDFRVETLRFADGFTLEVGGIGFAKTGDAGDNTLAADGVTLSDEDGVWFAGGSGDDTLDGSGNGDILVGGHGSDVLVGKEGDDTLVGGEGDDDLSGGAGDDDLFGGDANEHVAWWSRR